MLKTKIPLEKIALNILEIIKIEDGGDVNLSKWKAVQLSSGIRHLEYFCKPEISKKVSAYAQRHDLLKDISKKSCLCQYSYIDMINAKKKNTLYKLFHFEHVMPVKESINSIKLLDDPTVSAITNILKLSDIAWILTEENRELTKNGFKSTRPENPWDAYSDIRVGIEMMSPCCCN